MRNINELIGIINGISFDGIINQLEIKKLSSWVRKNRNLSYESRQAKLISLVDQVLEDGIITVDERKKLIEYCKQYKSEVDDSSGRIYELNGIIEGIICDNEINETEVYRLREWMQENATFIRRHKPSKVICEMIDEILADGVVTLDEQEALLDMLSQRISSTQLETKIGCLKRCVHEKKNIGIDLIDLLDNEAAIDVIHERAEKELKTTLHSYSAMYVADPEIVFVSLVLIGMLHYDGSFYEYVRKTYGVLYDSFPTQKIEGLIRTILNKYRTTEEVKIPKSRIINVVLANSIVPSYYLGSFFEFIYDIYKLNFDSDIPDDLYGEFKFAYEGLQSTMRSDGDDVHLNVTKKTYKLIKATKQLIADTNYVDAVIKLSIIVVRLIDKCIWNKDVLLYNPYLKKGYQKWTVSLKKEKDLGLQRQESELRSRWEPNFVLNGNSIFLVPPVHRVKSQYDYRDIQIIIKNGEEIIYRNKTPDIREIIGGYQVTSGAIELLNPLGKIAYLLVTGKDVIYDSRSRLYRSFISFDQQGQELDNNKDYSGTAIFCTNSLNEKLTAYYKCDNYILSSFSAHASDAILIDDKVFNFSDMIQPGVFGEKYDGYFLFKYGTNNRIEIIKNNIILIFESGNSSGRFEIQINHKPYKLKDFQYSMTERKGINKYTVSINALKSGIYTLSIFSLENGRKASVLNSQFAVDNNLKIEKVLESENSYIVSVRSDLIKQSVIEEIFTNKFAEDWLQFDWAGKKYIYYIPLDFKLYRLNGGKWHCFTDEIWIGDIAQDSTIDIYGTDYCVLSVLTSAGQVAEDAPRLKNMGWFLQFQAGFLMSYKSNYDYVLIFLSKNGNTRDSIFCYNKCILDEERTDISYDHQMKCLNITPLFYGKGNIRFRIITDFDEIVYTSSSLESNVQEIVFDLYSFTNYRIVFFEKEKGLSLKKERVIKEYNTIFYARQDFVGRSFKIKEVYYDQFVRDEFLRKKYYFKTTYVYFKEMKTGDTFVGEVYAKTYNDAYMLDNINPVDIEICSDVIDGTIELSITKDGDGLLLDFKHHGIMNSMDDDRAVDIYSYSMDMKGVKTS